MTNTPVLTWPDLEPRFQALAQDELSPETAPAWLERWSDLEKEFTEHLVRLGRAKDENTADEAAAKAYADFVQGVYPPSQIAQQGLNERLLALEWTPRPEHVQMLRRIRNEAELYCEANAQLQADVEMKVQSFGRLTGGLRVELAGETLNLAQAFGRLVIQDRAGREAAWRGIGQARQGISEALDALMLSLVQMRRQEARNAGFESYLEYGWRGFGRFDYTPQDALALHRSIALEVVPIHRQVFEERRESLKLETLRPWDLQADPSGQPPLKPFSSVQELEEGAERIFAALDPELGAQFAALRAAGNLDLEPRPNKVPATGYCAPLPVSGSAYILWSAVGVDADLRVITHEGGHALHLLASQGPGWLNSNALAPLEFAETVSQGMELLTLPLLEKPVGFYSPEEALRARRDKLEVVVRQFSKQAQADAFQHWLYTEAPEALSAADLDAKWLELSEVYLPSVDWSGLERERAKGWQEVPHLFTTPLYMIEYSIAWLGALQLWKNALEDRPGTLERFKAAMALGNTRPLPELFEAAGIRFAFDQDTVRELMGFVRAQLEQTSAALVA